MQTAAKNKNQAPRFRSYRVKDKLPVLGPDGKQLHVPKEIRNPLTGKTETHEVPLLKEVERRSWSFEAAISFIRKHDMALAKQAAQNGWHMFLIGFVQCRHALPANDTEILQIIEDARKVPLSALSKDQIALRKARADELTA